VWPSLKQDYAFCFFTQLDGLVPCRGGELGQLRRVLDSLYCIEREKCVVQG
jgi:hypothetical protein